MAAGAQQGGDAGKTQLRQRARGPSVEKTAQTRSAIVSAALAEFLERGFARATMDAVARRAGVAKGTPYRYFPTKEALFEGVVRQEIAGAVVNVNAANRAPGEKVGAFLRRTMSPAMQVVERQGRAALARLVLTEGVRFPVLVEIYRREMFDPLLNQLRNLVRSARAEGELKSDALVDNPELLIAPIWYGIVHNGLLDRSQPLDIGALFEANLDLLFDR
ncbi:TetR/AcrR family transcriptional regulator [Methylocystis sp. MJC1]|jgi:AcrR family transcriptional regulator|uniref:TetR/AcrR family transcriptional regulator n=1 Tax=Methylocystis sp. MJC1 TaxID=2654282 RepID=UPI0013EE364F|nr:TetR/AcrR family transcriptional regulator [Methylocystis sp. MJC1]KAF2992498.1 HTH-type transcriptional regulator RutR [Methylocystis sp. MJC1]MBU6526475.1 TetR/AcrR family transcriptional regulator [Methylocystis sp. MJC1]UZX12916.1 TetR/AcrR family transcriptional regulator [Methylocystis sp. MJC1]